MRAPLGNSSQRRWRVTHVPPIDRKNCNAHELLWVIPVIAGAGLIVAGQGALDGAHIARGDCRPNIELCAPAPVLAPDEHTHGREPAAPDYRGRLVVTVATSAATTLLPPGGPALGPPESE
jgi:hypothetical protein